MFVKTKAVVINSVRYQEKALIAKCFTLSDGMKSYFVRDAFATTKKSTKKSAYFQPFTLLEIEANHKNKNTLEYFSNIKPQVYQTITNDIIKSSLVIFLSEVVNTSLKDESKNEDLFLFLEASLLWLDQNPTNINFHLVFMIELTKFFGFYPHSSTAEYFDMAEGVFTNYQTKYCLTKEKSDWLKQLLKQKINSQENPFKNTQRRVLLEILLDYYALHIENFKKPNSWQILQEIFI